MTAYFGSSKIKDTGEYGVYLGSQNTNCLTYTPKNVNLTLVDGTLTLKKGSKVYVPNGKNADGSNKFDEVVIASDIVHNYQSTTTGQTMVFLYPSRAIGAYFYSGDGISQGYYSGSTAPSGQTYMTWYDTTNNLVKYTDNGGSTWTSGCSLPIAIGSYTNSWTSIDQIFDWCGYIGSTIFVVPNVEGLIPDGFNADGTYKSKKFKTTTVALATNPDKNDKLQYIHITDYGGIARDNIYHVSETQPTFGENSNQLWYNPKTNLMYYYRTTSNNGFKSWTLSGITFKGSSDARISEFNIGYTAQPEMTLIPINAIYNGSEKVYQYLPSPTTFNAGSNLVTYTVPKGCTKLGIDCVASKGGNFTATGGNGGRVTCDLSVTSGQTLYITVGAIPTDAATATYNASDIRIGGTDYANRVIVAGGGGNGAAGSNAGGIGAAGGGLTGADGVGINNTGGGKGGSQTAGGAKGAASTAYGSAGKDGTLGLGGNGASVGGAGGAGYYGGGGAAYASYGSTWGGGGGGGSSYTSSACSNVVHTQGYQNGAGYIKITPKK